MLWPIDEVLTTFGKASIYAVLARPHLAWVFNWAIIGCSGGDILRVQTYSLLSNCRFHRNGVGEPAVKAGVSRVVSAGNDDSSSQAQLPGLLRADQPFEGARLDPVHGLATSLGIGMCCASSLESDFPTTGQNCKPT